MLCQGRGARTWREAAERGSCTCSLASTSQGEREIGRGIEGGDLMLTIVIALVFALARINQADDAVSFQLLHVQLGSDQIRSY